MNQEVPRLLLLAEGFASGEELLCSLRQQYGNGSDEPLDATKILEQIKAGSQPYQVVLLDDLALPANGSDPMKTCQSLITEFKLRCPQAEAILVTGQASGGALPALPVGLLRPLSPPLNLKDLTQAVREGVEYQKLCEATHQQQVLGRLMESGAALLSGRTRQEVLELILLGVQECGFDRVRLYLLSPDGQMLVGVAQVGMAEHHLADAKWPAATDYYFQQMLQQARPYIFQSLPGRPDPEEERFDKADVEEWASVPLVLRDRVIGQLSADNKFSRRRIQEVELAPLALFAMQAAAAIEKAGLIEQAERKAEQLEALRRTTLTITSTSVQKRQILLPAIVAQAAELLRAKSAGLYEYHSEREELELIADHNQPAQIGRILKLGEGVAGWLVQSGAPYRIVPDGKTDPAGAEVCGQRRHFDKVLGVPLNWQGQIIGVLYVNDEAGREFTIEDVRLLGLFAEQAAIVLANQELSARDEKKLKLFEKLAQATTEIVGQIGKRDVHELLTLVAQHACDILAAEVCGVLLLKSEDVLSLEASYGHLPGSFEQGLKIPILSGSKTGFTGHIAQAGKLINLHGGELLEHPAVHKHENNFTQSGFYHSVLAVPLKKPQEKPIGLLHAFNKKDGNGQAHPSLAFTKEDEWIISIFAEVIVVCLESARLVEHRKLLVRNQPHAVIAIDHKGNVTEFNQEAERILGYTAEEVLGRKVSLLYHNPTEPKLIGQLLKQRSDSPLHGYETMMRTKLGQPLPIRLSAYWLYERGQRVGSVGIFEDLYKERLELTLRAIRTVAEAEDLRGGLQRLAELLIKRFPGAFCRILLFDESETLLVAHAAAYQPGNGGPENPPAAISNQFAVEEFPELAELLQAGQPVRLKYSNPRVRANLQKFSEMLGFNQPVQSLLLIPLKLGERVLGLLDLGEFCPEGQSLFTGKNKDNVDLAAAIAAQSTFLIGRIQSAERGRAQLLSFYDVSSKLIAQKNPDKLLSEIVEETLKAAGAISVDLVLIPKLGRAETPISIPQRLPHKPLDIRHYGVSMKVFETGIAKYFPDLSKERGKLNPELINNAKAAICLPLSLPYRRIGVMWLRYNHLWHFTEQEIVALQLYVNQAAMAYENAQEQARLERLRRAAAELAGEMELDKVRAQILASARKVLGADAVIFGFFDHEHDTFVRNLSSADGIPPEIWEKHRAISTGKDTTAYRLLEKGVVSINDVSDLTENALLGETTKKMLVEIGVVSFQAIALKVGTERLGLVCALYRQPHTFTEKEQLSATSFARYAALALKKARLVEQVKKTNQAATAVAKITMRGERQATLKAIVREVREVIGCDVVELFEYDRDKELQLPPTVAGVWHPEKDFNPEEEYRLVYQVLNENKPQKIEQVSAHAEFKDGSFAKNEKIESFVAFPLYATGVKVGVIFISYRTPHHFTAEELATIELFANQAALAIHYAQSTEADARRLRELEALEKLSDRLRRAQSLQDMMDCTVELATKELGTDYCNLILPDRNGELHLRAQFGWEPPLDSYYLESGTGSQTGYTIQTRQPVSVNDYSTEGRFKVSELLFARGPKSSLSMPMFRDGQVVGALLTYSIKSRQFTEEEVRFFGLIANHAAMALRGMERYEDLQRRDRHLDAVHNSSRAILASFGDEQAVLDQVIKEAVESVTGISRPKAVIGSLQLYDADHNELVIRSVYPTKSFYTLQRSVENGRWSLDKTKARNGRIGVTGRTIHEGCSQLVGDVSQDPDYIESNGSSKSELSVPLMQGYKSIGTINVESKQLNGFDEDDKMALEALAEHAVIAIQNAKTKVRVDSSTALAWMGMASSVWRHAVVSQTLVIKEQSQFLRHDLTQEVTPAILSRVKERLAMIEELADEVVAKPMTPMLSSKEGSSLAEINQIVRDRILRLQEQEPYKSAGLILDLRSSNSDTIRVSSDWLRRALDILVDNAVEAVQGVEVNQRSVCVSTLTVGERVKIIVADNGQGVPAGTRDKLFQHRIEKPPGAKGFGMGLLIAQTIVEAYDGDIKLDKTGLEGTQMTITFPRITKCA